jgi:hypothetical protein
VHSRSPRLVPPACKCHPDDAPCVAQTTDGDGPASHAEEGVNAGLTGITTTTSSHPLPRNREVTDNHGDQLTYDQVWEKARVAMEHAFHRSGCSWIVSVAEGAPPLQGR